jgi:predicted ATPase
VRSIETERVLVIGTYRDTEPGEPLISLLADLHRERAVERLRLGSLHRGEVATMVSAWLRRAPPTHFAHALHRETEGNPFFIEEVLRHLTEVAAIDETEWRRLASFTELGIPEGVREAIEQRLVALSPATRRIVTVAAAIGRSFSIELLEAVAESPGERVYWVSFTEGLLKSGARAGEYAGVREQDVDLDALRLHIRGGVKHHRNGSTYWAPRVKTRGGKRGLPISAQYGRKLDADIARA